MNKKNVFLAFVFSALLCPSLAKRDAIDAGGSCTMSQRGLYSYDVVGAEQPSMGKRQRSIYRDHGNGMRNEKKKRTDWLDFAAADEVLAASEAQLEQKYQKSMPHMAAKQPDNEKDVDVDDVNADAEGDAEAEADADADADATGKDDADADKHEHPSNNNYLHKKLKMLGFIKVKSHRQRNHRENEKWKEELQERDFGMEQNGEDDDQPQ